MTSDEIRAAFLNFFEGKGHKIVPSASLIPHGDPTLLLTSAGMVQFKPYYLGEAVPPNPRLASCQKCFRATDIESVGDSNHLTFFEMLGNFSIGDYFKHETINWAWEFVTQNLRLSPQHLWITIFLSDDESFQYWRELGVPERRILRYGEKDNFWGPAGDSGPCGPCSEIHYDFGEKVGCGRDSCAPDCGCGRFSEIWNLVFTQYNQDKNGQRTPLLKPNIDTGMGLERIATIMQGKTSVYETDLFAPLLKCISDLAENKYGADSETDNAIRVIAEHSRGIAFLINDGVVPSNDGRGYVLRRLLRRTVLFGRRLGLDKPFLAETARITIKQMRHIYPELEQRQDFIIKVIELEEGRFSETLTTGLELLAKVMAKATGKEQNRVSGKQAFKLYDTYGFPIEITSEIANGQGFSVDLDGFEREMDKQRERAKATHKFELAEQDALKGKLDIKPSSFTGYCNLTQTSNIVSLLVNNEPVDKIEEGQQASLVLETTPFYAEMGGQVGDSGEISNELGKFSVTNTTRVTPEIIAHQGHITEGNLNVGDRVEAVVDRERRLDIARNHTTTHLLQLTLRQVLGEHIQQRGSLVAPDRLRFDFSHLTAMTKEELQATQRIVNEKIRQNLPVDGEQVPYKQAIKEGAIALFDEKYGDIVRVLRIGQPAVSTELCGGTHVNSTGEIGFFNIIGESSIGSGLRRIEAVTGRGAEAFGAKRYSDLEEKVSSTASALDMERKQVLTLQRELAKKKVESLLGQVETVKGVKLLATRCEFDFIPRTDVLREMADLLREKLKSAVIVLGTVYEGKPAFIAAVTQDLVAKGYNAGNIVKQVAKVTGGGGGGKPNLAQAGGKYKDKIDEALRLAKSLI